MSNQLEIRETGTADQLRVTIRSEGERDLSVVVGRETLTNAVANPLPAPEQPNA